MSNAMLQELKPIAGWTDRDLEQITISGNDPVLHTRFPVGEIAAGVHAACGLASAKLWELRTGRRQQVSVDVRSAVATMQSFFYFRLFAPPPQVLSQFRIGGFYLTRDNRWFYVHPGTDFMRVLKVLGCENNFESCTDAVSKRDSNELEDAFAEYGLSGAIARSAKEWAKHQQGKILSSLPVVDIIKIGDSPPEPLPRGDRPLSGVRCLDLTRILAGPTSARTLAEHGADVLWVGAQHLLDVFSFSMDTGHGKRPTFLDLRQSTDREKLWKLTEQADVFCQSYRLGAIAGHGFSPEEVAARRPGIIYSSINCYGPIGPWAGRRGWEQLGQTVSGLAIEEGQLPPPPVDEEYLKLQGDSYVRSWHSPVGQPRLLPGAVNDYTTGYLLAFGTMVALYRRALEGGSYAVRCSLSRTAMSVERMGRVDKEKAMAQSEFLPSEFIERISLNEDTPYGRIRYIGPVVQMSETPVRWAQPTVPRGTHQAVWLDR